MKLIVGCPVAYREWSLPLWFECLAKQTRRPDGFVFLHSGFVGDATWNAIGKCANDHGFDNVVIVHDPTPYYPRHNDERFRTLADLRNRVLDTVKTVHEPDLFMSLDTDVMLERFDTIERLERHVLLGEYQVASPLTFLHPAASRSDTDVDICWAYNAGWLGPGPQDSSRRPWVRPAPDQIEWGGTVEIQIPMAAWLADAAVLDCRYQWHESGEDIGFAQSLERHGFKCLWDTSLRCRHVWCELDLIREAQCV